MMMKMIVTMMTKIMMSNASIEQIDLTIPEPVKTPGLTIIGGFLYEGEGFYAQKEQKVYRSHQRHCK